MKLIEEPDHYEDRGQTSNFITSKTCLLMYFPRLLVRNVRSTGVMVKVHSPAVDTTFLLTGKWAGCDGPDPLLPL